MSADSKYKLVVVTVTYKPDKEEFRLFLDSFFEYNDLGDEARLIVVDNSPENSWDLKTFKRDYPSVDFVPNPENPGFGASNNKGFDLYKSDYVLFINNDVEFLEPVFNPLIKEFEKDNSIGCIGIHQEGGAPSFFQKITAPNGTTLDSFDEKLHFVSGAFMFFKSSCFEEIGRFDPKLFMYLEEFDLSERLIQHKYKTIYLPDLHFLHKVGNRRNINPKTWIRLFPSLIYICDKYHLDLKEKSSGAFKRLRLLFLYHLCHLKIGLSLKILKLYCDAKKIVSERERQKM